MPDTSTTPSPLPPLVQNSAAFSSSQSAGQAASMPCLQMVNPHKNSEKHAHVVRKVNYLLSVIRRH
jgi:hypothetical protein